MGYAFRMGSELILIVDDAPINLTLTRIFLAREGYQVVTAESAEEALDLLRNYRPRLVLTDVNLPGMNGLELARRIRQEARTLDMGIIAWTASPPPGVEQQALEAGCDAMLTKSIEIDALAAHIRHYLERHPAIRAVAAGEETPAAPAGIDLEAIRRRFLDEGGRDVRQMLNGLDSQFDAREAVRTVHQWVGTGGLLGYPAISRMAREVESILREPPFDNAQLRDSLTSLASAFAESG